jgi:hypothetical protein
MLNFSGKIVISNIFSAALFAAVLLLSDSWFFSLYFVFLSP